jgi:hypothetical protein
MEALAALGLPALRLFWAERWGRPPQYRSRDLMLRALAYRLQVQAEGGLPGASVRRMAVYAAKFMDDRKFTPTPGPLLKPGASLVREWQGARHEVLVTGDGFLYRGRRFRSLSQVAQTITGTKWNGLLFFGLKTRSAA